MSRFVRFGTGRLRMQSRPNKHNNTKTVRHGMVFDSKREANRYESLLLLQANGELRNLRRQVKYDLVINGIRIATYKADFVYEELRKGAWSEVVEDSKGYPNDRWPMKKKLMRAIHGVEVRET
jgi:hypothetical protein